MIPRIHTYVSAGSPISRDSKTCSDGMQRCTSAMGQRPITR